MFFALPGVCYKYRRVYVQYCYQRVLYSSVGTVIFEVKMCEEVIQKVQVGPTLGADTRTWGRTDSPFFEPPTSPTWQGQSPFSPCIEVPIQKQNSGVPSGYGSQTWGPSAPTEFYMNDEPPLTFFPSPPISTGSLQLQEEALDIMDSIMDGPYPFTPSSDDLIAPPPGMCGPPRPAAVRSAPPEPLDIMDSVMDGPYPFAVPASCEVVPPPRVCAGPPPQAQPEFPVFEEEIIAAAPVRAFRTGMDDGYREPESFAEQQQKPSARPWRPAFSLADLEAEIIPDPTPCTYFSNAELPTQYEDEELENYLFH